MGIITKSRSVVQRVGDARDLIECGLVGDPARLSRNESLTPQPHGDQLTCCVVAKGSCLVEEIGSVMFECHSARFDPIPLSIRFHGTDSTARQRSSHKNAAAYLTRAGLCWAENEGQGAGRVSFR